MTCHFAQVDSEFSDLARRANSLALTTPRLCQTKMRSRPSYQNMFWISTEMKSDKLVNTPKLNSSFMTALELWQRQNSTTIMMGIFALRSDIAENMVTGKAHNLSCKRNSQYTSPKIQNEIINVCNHLVLCDQNTRLIGPNFFSVQADETTDAC